MGVHTVFMPHEGIRALADALDDAVRSVCHRTGATPQQLRGALEILRNRVAASAGARYTVVDSSTCMRRQLAEHRPAGRTGR